MKSKIFLQSVAILIVTALMFSACTQMDQQAPIQKNPDENEQPIVADDQQPTTATSDASIEISGEGEPVEGESVVATEEEPKDLGETPEEQEKREAEEAEQYAKDLETYKQSKDENNKELCNQINDLYLKDACLENPVINTPDEISSDNNDIQDDKTLFIEAVSNNNPDKCNGIQNADLKEKCLLDTK